MDSTRFRPSFVSDDREIARAGHPNRLDESLLTQMAEIADRDQPADPVSRRSRPETTRNAPTVDNVRVSEPRKVY